MRAFRRFPGLMAAGVLLGGWPVLLAQTADRVVQEINPNVTVTLAGSVNPRAAAQYDIGRMAPATPIHSMTLHFQPTAEQQAELDGLVKAQQTPGSPEYHQWLTPAQYANRFGMSEGDIQRVESWLESQGFNVERAANSRTSITFSGTAGQVESAFGTEMHQYRMDGETHFANATNLSIPAALAGIVQSVGNLNNFRPRPDVRYHREGAVTARPAFTSAVSGEHFMTPGDVATIYDIDAAYNAGDTGSGQTIVVAGQSAIETSDIEAFQTAAGLTVKAPTLTLVPGTGTSTTVAGDEAESDLDVEYSGAIGREATIDFVYVGNDSNASVFDSVQYAIDNKLGPIINMSYGACETQFSGTNATEYSTLESIMEQGAVQGQSIVASSGDDGSTSCFGTPGLTTAQQEALAVNYPASSAYVTGVGGTEFPSADVAVGNTTYWQASSGSDVVSSALGYIPEMAWNDDSAAAGAQYGAQYALSSGGGGTSTLTARPSWQTGVTGMAVGSYRLVPDVSLDSSADNAGYLYCTSDTSAWSSGQKASCNSGFRDSSTQDLTIAGGTSFAAPIFAGMLSIINQKVSSTGEGVAASMLYSLAADTTTYASAFHDITTGGNQCTAGSNYCSAAGESEYPTEVGYDEATGLGSVDFNNLMTAWAGGSTTGNLDGTTTTVAAATLTPASGANDVITITVAPTSSSVTATPTGTLTVTVDGTVETSTLALSNGVATYTFSSTTAGAHTIDATYSGDTTFATSSGSATVTVQGAASGTFTLTASNATAAQGSNATSTITVTPANSYTGTVAFTATSSSTSLTTNGCFAVNNATVASGSTMAIATLTIYTSQSACAGTGVHSFAQAGGTTRASSEGGRPQGPVLPVGAAALAGCLLFGFGRVRKAARRKTWVLLGCLLLMAMVGLATGCGGTAGTGTGTGTSNDVATGTYTVTVTGADTTTASITATTTLTLTVD